MKKIVGIVAVVLCVALCFGMAYAENLRTADSQIVEPTEQQYSVNKITEELLDKMENSSEQLFSVYVWLQDIDTEEVLNVMPQTLSLTEDDSDIQAYIAQKRNSMSEAYSSHNFAFLNAYDIEDSEKVQTSYMMGENTSDGENEAIQFVSSYAPMCILNLSTEQIMDMAEDEKVCEIGLCERVETVPAVATGTAGTMGTYVRDTNGYTGEGVMVGVCEAVGFPDKTYSELKDATIITNDALTEITDDHATQVTTIICGQTLGLAPDCTVYATYAGDNIELYKQMEWLIEQNVNVINLSLSFNSVSGYYSLIDMWIDHVDMNHDILVVSAAGNYYSNSNQGRVTAPAMAYNGISVGAYCTNDSNGAVNHNNDTVSTFSCYMEYAVGTDEVRPEKPDIIAPGENLYFPGMVSQASDGLFDGTSYAAPMVTGTVAQMLDARSDLKKQPAIIKAALLASSFRKVSTANYGTLTGDAPYLSDKEGAGKLDSKNAIYVITSTNYTYEYFWSGTQTYTFTFSANASESQMRVALTWLKQSVFDEEVYDDDDHEGELSPGLIEDRDMANWDLEVYDPNGNLVSYSRAKYGNVEIAEFDPNVTGTYTVKIIKQSGDAPKEFVYLAWW